MDNTLLGRCTLAYEDAFEAAISSATWPTPSARYAGTRAILEHLAAEMVVVGHQDAAAWVLGQLTAQVIPLRPRTPGDAA